MTNQELERRLADALSRTALNDLEGVLSRCKAQKGNVIQMTTKKKNPLIKNLICICKIKVDTIKNASFWWCPLFV